MSENKIKHLPREFGDEYVYEVDGCVFTLRKGDSSRSNVYYLTGYKSMKDYKKRKPFEDFTMPLKRHAMYFLKYTFKRKDWV